MSATTYAPRQPSAIVSCETCGKSFRRKPSRLSKHNFCRRTCINTDLKRTGEIKQCEVCGTSFYKEPSKAEGRFCSRACGFQRRPHNGIERQCDGCGKVFYIHPSQVKKNKRFCSRGCQGKTLAITCEVCGKAFQRKTSQLKDVARPCCSRACTAVLRKQWMSGEESPTWKGGYKEYYGPSWLEARRIARKRDKYACRHCGVKEKKLGRELDVHHIQPFRTFDYIPGTNDNHLAANAVANLISLCPACHKLAEHEHIPVQLGLC